MTERFASFSKASNHAALIMVIIAIITVMIPAQTFANRENKTDLPLEIKSVLNIPTPDEIIVLMTKPEPTVQAAAIEIEEIVVIEEPVNPYVIPPKVVGDDRIYMHEPQIRSYICPKMGQSECDIFVAILKAENGTHECTRDNRGLNKNGSIDIGLAQINWKPGNPWHTFEQLQDCKYNLDVALEMYSRRGFSPWYAYTKGVYKRFL